MSAKTSDRKVVQTEFSCMGAYTVLSSQSLGGSDTTPGQLAETLQNGSPAEIAALIEAGICMPIEFDGDCALNNVPVVIGELSAQEESEWIGRLAGSLKIPCGKFLLLAGGGEEEDWEQALDEDADPETPEAYFVEVAPGDYRVEVYAFLNSLSALRHFEDLDWLAGWWTETRPGEDMTEYVKLLSEDEGWQLRGTYVKYLIRLAPLEAGSPVPVANQGWLSEFTFRKPDKCPLGIRTSDLSP